VFPKEAEWAFSTFWMYTVLLEPGPLQKSRDMLIADMQELGIQTRPLWQANHMNKPYRDCQVLGRGIATRLAATSLSLPCSVGLESSDLVQVSQVLRRLVEISGPRPDPISTRKLSSR